MVHNGGVSLAQVFSVLAAYSTAKIVLWSHISSVKYWRICFKYREWRLFSLLHNLVHLSGSSKDVANGGLPVLPPPGLDPHCLYFSGRHWAVIAAIRCGVLRSARNDADCSSKVSGRGGA